MIIPEDGYGRNTDKTVVGATCGRPLNLWSPVKLNKAIADRPYVNINNMKNNKGDTQVAPTLAVL